MSTPPRYEIFETLPKGTVRWVETTTSLQSAQDRVKQLVEIKAGKYFIFDTENVRFVYPSALDS